MPNSTLISYGGKCLLPTAINIQKGLPDATIMSDASGNWGCGAWYWFQLQCPDDMQSQHIAVKELIPTIIATLVWRPHHCVKQVLSSCDNSTVVSVLNNRYSWDTDLMQLLHCLFCFGSLFSLQSVSPPHCGHP